MTETLTAREDVSERTPTPVGWSDTDWIKHLADWRKHDQEQPHPMAGLHINQGSLDAAADAYGDEYNKAHGIGAPEKGEQ